jgi:4-hydroxybenzoate polyprenyltransferase
MPKVLKSLRPHFWLFSIIPGTAGILLSANSVPLKEFLLVSLALGSISGIAELVNNYVDQELDVFQKVKKLGRIPISGGSGVSSYGWLKKREVIYYSVALALISIVSAILVNKYVLSLVLIGLFMAFGYSVKPLRFKTRGVLGILAMAIGRGFISFHIGWIAIALPNLISMTIGVFLSLVFFGTAYVGQLSDYAEDKEWSIYTFPVQVGVERANKIAVCFILSSLVFLPSSYLLLNRFVPVSFTINPLLFAFVALSLTLCWLIVRFKVNDFASLSRLQVLALVIFFVAPFIFI